MMAANYRHIGGGVNRLGRHYSRFSGFWPMASVVDQSLALRKSQNRESNRRRRANGQRLSRVFPSDYYLVMRGVGTAALCYRSPAGALLVTACSSSGGMVGSPFKPSAK